MGYATVMRVPRINNYAEAVRKMNNTKPIKGRDPVVVPLGERRDCDTYSIRKNIWNENMELVLYQTPVIKFTPDDEVLINFGRWSSASTCQFISRVLSSVSANRPSGFNSNALIGKPRSTKPVNLCAFGLAPLHALVCFCGTSQ